MPTMLLWVIVAAAGRSSRYATDPANPRNKLDEDLGGRPVIRRAVELFTKRPEVAGIVVAAPHHAFDDFKLRHADALAMLGCTIVPGGPDHRSQSVAAALEHIPHDATHIAVHDAARPCTDGLVLDRTFAAANNHPAVVPAIPVNDTLKRVHPDEDTQPDDPLDAILGDAGKHAPPNQRITETIDRTNTVAVQTPQIFHAELLRRAYEQPDLNATDDAQLVERLGETVRAVPGDPTNIKITTPGDLELARLVIGAKPSAQRPTHKRF